MQKVGRWYLPDSDTYFGPIIQREGAFQLERLREALKLLPLERRVVAVDGG